MEFCPTCGSVMLDTPKGLMCSNRDCGKESNEHEYPICPTCKKGHLLPKLATRGKSKGKTFWACNEYPKCKTIFNDEPVNMLCPVCGAQMVKKGDVISCSDSKCEKFVK